MPSAESAKAGIKVRDASRMTGLSLWQIRELAYSKKVRSRKSGCYLVIHPDDVAALAKTEWQGEPYVPKTASPVAPPPSLPAGARSSSTSINQE